MRPPTRSGSARGKSGKGSLGPPIVPLRRFRRSGGERVVERQRAHISGSDSRLDDVPVS
jgi:hypothetical protein